jgi:DNA-binding response OmpR family regulator
MAPSLNLIVVEDHDALRAVTLALLTEHGHQVMGVGSAEALDDEAGGRVADIYLLDLNLPGEDGISLSRRLRRAHPGVGIIMITARNQSQDNVDGYDSGADIYLTKPLDQNTLLAAVNALARRIKPVTVKPVEAMLMLNVQRLLLIGAQASVPVSDAEATLLCALVSTPGQRLTFGQLHEALLQLNNDANKASLEVRMVRLRKKLTQASGDNGALKAIRNHGYQLCTVLRLG